MAISAFISGLAGLSLSPDEAVFLRSSRPAGIILFARNIDHPDQVRKLIAEARHAIGTAVLVLVDQEGGRVQRLRPPHWRALPSGSDYAARAALDLDLAVAEAFAVSRLIAHDLKVLGINCNCTPVLDVPVPGAHAVIGSRALGANVATIIALGRAIADGHMAGGVLPVIKHIPGHGRALVDTHHELPTVTATEHDLAASDFAAFKALAHLPAAMTAHVVFSAIDATATASTSALVTQRIIREHIGFDGLLMSDDLSMQALHGSLGARAASVLAAGTDLALHCNGMISEMAEVAAAVPALTGAALARYERAVKVTSTALPFSMTAAEACLTRISATS